MNDSVFFIFCRFFISNFVFLFCSNVLLINEFLMSIMSFIVYYCNSLVIECMIVCYVNFMVYKFDWNFFYNISW